MLPRKMQQMIEFHTGVFDFTAHRQEGDRIVELRPESAGLTLLLHPAGKGRKEGQSLMKLVFDVENVEGFCRRVAEHGVAFGSVHRAEGYVFANARDPSGNSISVSGRAFADPHQ